MWIFKVWRHGYLFKYPYNLMTMKNESYLCSFQRWCGKYGISQSGARGGLFIHPHMYLFPSCNAIKLLFLQDMKKQNALRQPMKPILFLFEEENCEFLSAPLKKARNLSEVERPKGYVRFSKTYLPEITVQIKTVRPCLVLVLKSKQIIKQQNFIQNIKLKLLLFKKVSKQKKICKKNIYVFFNFSF